MDISILPDIEVEEGFDPEAEIAREVLKDQLGDMFSQEDEEFHALAWENVHGRLLKRSWDSWKTYATKKKAYKPAKPVRTYSMDTNSAQDWLKRLRSKDALTVSDVNEIASLEEMLDLKHTDIEANFQKREIKDKETEKVEVVYFRKKLKQEEDIDTLAGFEVIQKQAVWADRVKLVHKEKDIGVLHLIMLRDNREEVRQAAEQRVMELEIAGK